MNMNHRFFNKKKSYDGEKARCEAGDEVFASSGTDDGVVSSRDSGAMISSHHKAHFNELAGIPRQPGHKRGPTMVLLFKNQLGKFQDLPAYNTDLLWNHRSPRVPPRPISDLKTSVMGMPA